MKTNLPLLSSRFLLLCLLFLPVAFFAQSIPATYLFSDNLKAEEMGPLDLSYYNSNNVLTTPGTGGVKYVNQYWIFGGSRMLETDDNGSYIQVLLNTTNLTNINVQFTGEMLKGLFASGEKGRLSLFADYTGTGSSFSPSLLDIDLNTGGGAFDVYDTETKSVNLPIAAEENPNLLLRIKVGGYQGIGVLDGEIRIDNLIITSKSPKILVSGYNTPTNLKTIPENAPAASLYGTDFGIVITDDPNAATKTFQIKNEGAAALQISNISFSGVNSGDFSWVPNTPTPTPAPIPTPTNPINSLPATINAGDFKEFVVKFNPSADGRRTAFLNITSNAKPSPYSFNVEGRGATCTTIDLALRKNTMETSQPTVEYLNSAAVGSSTFRKISGNSRANNTSTSNTLSGGTFGTRLYCDISTNVPLSTTSTTSWYTRSETSKIEFGPVENIVLENGVYISFNLAAFSTLTTTDFKFDDYVELQVLNPTINDWSPVLKILGNTTTNSLNNENTRYSFAVGKTAMADYDGDSTPVLFNNGNGIANKYSKVKVKIPGTSSIDNLLFRIIAKNDSDQKLWLIDDVAVYSAAAVTRRWTAANQWVNRNDVPDTDPNKNIRTIIDNNYTTTTNGNFTGCDCTVNSGKSLTINTGGVVTLQTKLDNEGNVTVESDASLIQKEDDALNEGDILVKRDLTFKNNDRKEYNYLISPVENANLKTDIYRTIGGTPVTAPFVLYHTESNNKFYNSSGAYIAGRSLAVKEPEFSSGAVPTAFFKGKPFNGIINYNLAYSGALLGYNLVGNPYPSNFDLLLLYGDNSTAVESTFRFWDNSVNSVYAQQGTSYTGDAYAIFNAASGPNGTGTPAPGTILPGDEGIKVPNKIVKVGQGFMVKSKGINKVLHYSNHIRLGDNTGSVFYGKQSPDNRYWLKMTAPSGIVSTIAMVYFDGGNNLFSEDDSRATMTSDVVYSLVEDEKLAINGRSNFANTDIVPLGTKHFVAGNYTIDLGDKEGIFATGQKIYLKDKQTGIITNLSLGTYTFAATAGESTGRFEIIYQPETILSTNANGKDQLIVYRDGTDFVVKSQGKKITSIELYDASGRLLLEIQPNDTKAVIQSAFLAQGVYVLKIAQNGQMTMKKIIK